MRTSKPLLFSPITLRGITLKNRVVISPMCQYSAHDGLANDWHFVHPGKMATGGAGDSARACRPHSLDAMEMHSAHGYLGHEFLSPLSNKRIDQYGGNLQGRMRYHSSSPKSCALPGRRTSRYLCGFPRSMA
jgi:2,4-dienoyl-CoA reductase-like NADH-dependent reductase (Old Yellow Enzyme family)